MDYSKKKYIAKRELASDDWKTQLAQGFKDIPKGAEVKMINKEYRCWYGIFSEIEWHGHTYYVSPNDIEEIEAGEAVINETLEAFKRICGTLDEGDNTVEYDGQQEDMELVEKVIKAFDIIKKKNVNVCLLRQVSNITGYNELMSQSHDKENYQPLLQEEYDLLKEVL